MFNFSRLVSINFIIGFLIILGISMGIHSINQKLDRIQELENILSDTQMETSNAVDKLSERIDKLEYRVTKKRNISIHYTKERMTHTSLDAFCLAKNIYHEARGQGDLGMYAIAQVTVNRLHNGQWGRTICDVVMSPMQFSWANDRSIRWKHPRGESWEQSKEMAGEVLRKGLRLRGLDKALFFHANYVNPKWASKKYYVVTIGDHIFYNNSL